MALVVVRRPTKTVLDNIRRHLLHKDPRLRVAIGLVAVLFVVAALLLRGSWTNGMSPEASFLVVESSLESTNETPLLEDDVQPKTTQQSAPAVSVLQQTTTTGAAPLDYPPLSCPTLLEKVQQEEPISVTATTTNTKNNGRIVTDPNQGKLHARKTDTPPHFTIALHNPQFDRTRWSIMEYGHYYETALIDAFSVVLNDTVAGETGSVRRVLDVGGNIGYFALLAAAHTNVVVDTFEPNLKNSFRVCQSLHLNDWSNEYEQQQQQQQHHQQQNNNGRSSSSSSSSGSGSAVNCYPYGVGKEVGSLVFEESSNPGQGQIRDGGGGDSNHKDDEASPSSTSQNTIPVISLDVFAESRGWLGTSHQPSTNVVIALMKVDVEGYEINVMQGAQRLLQSHIIRNIFMEVSARNPKEIEESRVTLTTIASAGYNVHQYGGFRGPKHTVNWSSQKNVTELVDLVMHEVTKKKHPQLNLWWSLS